MFMLNRGVFSLTVYRIKNSPSYTSKENSREKMYVYTNEFGLDFKYELLLTVPGPRYHLENPLVLQCRDRPSQQEELQ